MAWCFPALQQAQQLFTGVTGALRDDQHPAVGTVGGIAGQAQLQRPRSGPPAEADALDSPVHPGGEPDVSAPTSATSKVTLVPDFSVRPDRAHLVDGALDHREHARLLRVVQARQVDLEGLFQQRVALLLAVRVAGHPDRRLVVVAEPTGQRLVAGHAAARGERDLHQLTRA